MYILFATLATLLLAFWIFLMVRSDKHQLVKLTLCAMRANELKISALKTKIITRREKLEQAGKWGRVCLSLADSEKSMMKKLVALKKENELLQNGRSGGMNLLPLAGYTALALLRIDGSTSPFFRKLIEQNSVLIGKQYAADNAQNLLASSISYAVLGGGVSLCISALLLMAGQTQMGLLIALIGTVLAVIFAYLPLDDLRERSEKRADEIVREFPHVVSKLTLLVGAGMDMTQAWSETASSKQGVLYREMQTVIDEIQNGISPYSAYNGFIHRCNDKFASKLGTSIMQNLTKGNEEICVLLRELTAESWSERRHYAKRKGETAQSKLLLPIMMMFGGIIFLVMMPVVSNFMGMGF